MIDYTARRIALQQLEATQPVERAIALLIRAEAGEAISSNDWEAASTLSWLPTNSEDIALDNSEYIGHWSTLWAVACSVIQTPEATAETLSWAKLSKATAQS